MSARMRAVDWLGISLLLLVAGMFAGCTSSGSGCKSCGKHGSGVSSTAGHDGPGQEMAAAQSGPRGAGQGLAYGGQRTCPVTGETLGSMGPAIPVNVKGQTIYVCCEGCATDVKSDPDAHLAKVFAERGGG